uniref:CSON001278 protein n=1 Tax=Culicoides sonorensis TaxID=179676 RepID=A0A336KZ92_CULSO
MKIDLELLMEHPLLVLCRLDFDMEVHHSLNLICPGILNAFRHHSDMGVSSHPAPSDFKC